MPTHGLLQDLALVLLMAALVTVVFRKLHLPAVLGYVAAGFLIGPHLLPRPLIHNDANIHTLSELGVIFLLFSLGLEFSLRKLREVGPGAILAGTIEISGMIFLGILIAKALGWSPLQGLFLGSILAISSTTIIVKVLSELKLKNEKFADMVFGILIVEDLAAILLLALLAGFHSESQIMGKDTWITLAKMAVFLIVSLVFGLMLVPKWIGQISKLKNDEMLLITVLALCLGFSALVLWLGYSVALGAFLMGALMAETRAIGKIEALMTPIRDLFCAVFFVSVGLLFDPSSLTTHALTVALLIAVLVLGKISLCSLGSFVAGRDFATSLRVGMSMAQIGEFSFVIASLGLTRGMDTLYPLAVSVSVFTTLLTPLWIRTSDPLAARLLRWLPKTLISYMDLYHRWTIQFSERSRNNSVQKILKKILLQLAIFLSIMSAAFIFAIFLFQILPKLFPVLEKGRGWLGTGLWLLALFVCIPLLLATFRKLKALGFLLAELGISPSMVGSKYREIRALHSSAFSILGIAGIIFLGSLLSAAILPSGGTLIFIIVVVSLVVYFQRDAFNKVYFQGKTALESAIDRPHITEADGLMPIHREHHEKFRVFLKDASLVLFKVEEQSEVQNKWIRETELRSNLGVSILAIERNADFIVNPGPDEELKEGDTVLILGMPDQVAQAKGKFVRNAELKVKLKEDVSI